MTGSKNSTQLTTISSCTKDRTTSSQNRERTMISRSASTNTSTHLPSTSLPRILNSIGERPLAIFKVWISLPRGIPIPSRLLRGTNREMRSVSESSFCPPAPHPFRGATPWGRPSIHRRPSRQTRVGSSLRILIPNRILRRRPLAPK